LFSIELFNEEIWEWDVDEVFAAAMQKTRKMLG